jgi:hypothetical protein
MSNSKSVFLLQIIATRLALVPTLLHFILVRTNEWILCFLHASLIFLATVVSLDFVFLGSLESRQMMFVAFKAQIISCANIVFRVVELCIK